MMGFWYNDIDAYVNLLDPIWHHIAGVWDGNKVSIYFDGKLEENLAPSLTVNTTVNETIHLRIGCQNSANNDNEFPGAIDEVMIFSRALDDNEIATIMDYNTQIDDETHMQVSSFKLYQNYPNPFNPITVIRFDLPDATNVNLSIYNVSGQLVSTLVNQYSEAGSYNVQWIAHDCPSGIYTARLRAGGFSTVMKMMLLK